MSDRERSSPTLIESGLKNLIGGRDSNYPLISGINGKFAKFAKRFLSFQSMWIFDTNNTIIINEWVNKKKKMWQLKLPSLRCRRPSNLYRPPTPPT